MDIRFKPLEYLCEDMTEEQLERIEVNAMKIEITEQDIKNVYP
jgi:hypothetical protein